MSPRCGGRQPTCAAGAECKAPAGAFVPIANRRKREAKGDCVEVCPYDVF
jgi:4Fe-4S ferredoxin